MHARRERHAHRSQLESTKPVPATTGAVRGLSPMAAMAPKTGRGRRWRRWPGRWRRPPTRTTASAGSYPPWPPPSARSVEDRRYLLPECPPSGGGDAALALCRAASPWKQLLGLTPCLEMEDLTLENEHTMRPWIFYRFLACVWLLAAVLVILISIGLQWTHCQREYLYRLMGYEAPPIATSAPEYLCVPSFIWTYLVPRLLWVFGYITVFVCWFCLRQPDLMWIVSRAYDAVTEQVQYVYETKQFIDYCRRDRRLLAFWFVATHVLSLLSSLLGEGIITHDLIHRKPPPESALGYATYVFTCLVRLMVDSVAAYCIVTHTLSLKYLTLMIIKTFGHLKSLCVVNSNINAFTYAFLRISRICQLVHRCQPCMSAAILMAMLRICQTVSLIWLDLTSQPLRFTSLGQLPMAVCFVFMILHHILQCIMLSDSWRGMRNMDPVFLSPPGPPDPDVLFPDVTPGERDERALALWREIIYQCPVVSGQVLGMNASCWMYWAFGVVGVLYCAGYHALLKHLPLV